MTRLDVDVAIAGSGFSGSILGAILQRQGMRIALIDRDRHPRFAIGESSTPTANLILRDLADRYGLSWLQPLSQYGTWKQSYPHVRRGIKRGFSYFWHENDREFTSTPDHRNELLVAASSSDKTSDTQWLRSDVDAFLSEQACCEGVTQFESTKIETLTALSPGWQLDCQTPDGPVEVRCRFLVDGTGAGRLLSQQLQIANDSHLLRTNSRAIFGHFAGLPRWSETLSATNESAIRDHPFDCDHSALHHLIPGGWMWWLRFDNDVTSVGLVVDAESHPANNLSADAEFAAALDRLPQLRSAFATAELVAPPGGLVRTGRLQRLANQIAGPDWAMLPHAVGFIDPLHSTGIAHSLTGVERLTESLLRDLKRDGEGLEAGLRNYSDQVRSELLMIDKLVSGCYSALRQRSFRKFVAWSMCYFAAATSWERRRLDASGETACLFLADDRDFQQAVDDLQSRLETETDSSFEQLCQQRLAPFNHVGLFHPPIPNMHARTAVPDA